MSDVATIAPPGSPLTRRELDALRAVWDAGNGADAAANLGISRNTLRTHLQNARSRLGARTTLEAIKKSVA